MPHQVWALEYTEKDHASKWLIGSMLGVCIRRKLNGWITGLLPALAVTVFPLQAGVEIGLQPRIELAAKYLMAAQLADGFFRYQIDLISLKSSNSNNIVRQAGAAYGLGEYFSHHPEPSAREAVRTALSAFGSSSINWLDGRLLSPDGQLENAKSGATALALLAAVMLLERERDPVIQRLAEGWKRGLLALQKSSGGFSYLPGKRRESPYSNGEIWLALSRYLTLHPGDPDVARALELTDRSFLSRYQAQPEIGFFHWGVMAAAERFRATGDHRFSRFIAAQIEDYLEHLRPKVSTESNSCYAVEGLVAGIGVLEQTPRYMELAKRTERRVQQEMQKNLGLQLLPGQTRIQFTAERYLVVGNIEPYAGAFMNGRFRPQVRVDATQHCLSAMLKLRSSAAGG